MKHLSQAQLEHLNQAGVYVFPKHNAYFGNDYGAPPSAPEGLEGQHEGYYFKREGVVCATVCFIDDKIYFERMERYAGGKYHYAEIIQLESLNEVVEFVVAAALLMRMNQPQEA